MSFDVSSSLNVKGFSSQNGFSELKQNHFEIEDRKERGISKDKNLEKLNMNFDYMDNRDLVFEDFENSIKKFNEKPSQKSNKNRQHKDLKDYIEKRHGLKRVNPDFHNVSFMMVAKLGDMDTWLDIVEDFNNKGVSEYELLESLNGAFDKHSRWFNERFQDANLEISSTYTNLDEKGSPHSHSELINKNYLKSGLPDLNLVSALKKVYGKGSHKEIMSKFREEVDSKLVDFSNERLKTLARNEGFEFQGLNFIRKKAEVVGLSHDRYVEDKKLESEIQAGISERIKELDEREKRLDSREASISAYDEHLMKKSSKLSEREKEVSNLESELDNTIKKYNSLIQGLRERDAESLEQARRIGKAYKVFEERELKELKEREQRTKRLENLGTDILGSTGLKRRNDFEL